MNVAKSFISGRVCHHSAAEWGRYGEGTPDYSAERTLVDVIFIHDPPEVVATLAPGGSLEELALQFCLREERIHGHLIDSLNIAQLERNVQAASTSMTDDVLTRFRSAAI